MELQVTEMPRAKRTYFVTPRKEGMVHRMIANSTSEGGRTACGRLVFRGWLWSLSRIRNRPVCKYCEC